MKQRVAIVIPALMVVVAVSLSGQTVPPKSTLGQNGKAAPPASKTQPKDAAKAAPKSKAALMDPAKLTAVAPPTYQASFETSAGTFVVEVHRDWAPKGADRFFNLVKNGFFDDCRFFRVIPGFMAQFGMNGDPAIQKHWGDANIPDDPVKQSNKRGFMSFANAGPNTRSTQVFINFADKNVFLDKSGFAAFGEVVSGMDAVDKLYSGYGDPPPEQQGRITAEGNKYLAASFPKLDYVKKATIVPAASTKK
jgi:peptidyl-prolyl cis-trans isomerase A (cyclophilin A)